jgi:translocation and assembly module TamA
MRLNDTWGLVGFWDRAVIGNDVNDMIDGDWYDSAGAGVRFFTSFAPLRFDVAFPLDARQSDDRFLLYFSLGQAF